MLNAYRLLLTACYWLLVALIFAGLLTVEIIRCFSPLLNVISYQVERTTEWYSLPTVTSNWHTHLADHLYGALSLLQRSLSFAVASGKLLAFSPKILISYTAEWDTDRRFC